MSLSNKDLIVRASYLTNNRSRLAIKVSYGEILLLALSWIIGFSVIISSDLDYAFNTSLLLIFVTFLGLVLSKNTARSLGDNKLNELGLLWLVKVLATIFLLYLGWIPDLYYSSSSSWGYDSQRYYQYSWALIENEWVPTFGLNYTGIVYYYSAIFYVICYNPLVASLINILVTLYGTLFLIRSSYAFVPASSKKDWSIAYSLLIPEMLWYDVMTSQETLLATLVMSVSLIIGRKITACKGEVMDS